MMRCAFGLPHPAGLPTLKLQKYWPPVARVDNVYGDKNVMCACIPVDAYKDEVEATLQVPATSEKPSASGAFSWLPPGRQLAFASCMSAHYSSRALD
jgi:hypothetical protein